MSKGQVGRGARRITSNGVASTSDPWTLAALLTKYVARTREIPGSVSCSQCVDNLDGLRETILDLEPGVSPGTGGMKNEYLRGVECRAVAAAPDVWDEVPHREAAPMVL